MKLFSALVLVVCSLILHLGINHVSAQQQFIVQQQRPAGQQIVQQQQSTAQQVVQQQPTAQQIVQQQPTSQQIVQQQHGTGQQIVQRQVVLNGGGDGRHLPPPPPGFALVATFAGPFLVPTSNEQRPPLSPPSSAVVRPAASQQQQQPITSSSFQTVSSPVALNDRRPSPQQGVFEAASSANRDNFHFGPGSNNGRPPMLELFNPFLSTTQPLFPFHPQQTHPAPQRHSFVSGGQHPRLHTNEHLATVFQTPPSSEPSFNPSGFNQDFRPQSFHLQPPPSSQQQLQPFQLQRPSGVPLDGISRPSGQHVQDLRQHFNLENTALHLNPNFLNGQGTETPNSVPPNFSFSSPSNFDSELPANHQESPMRTNSNSHETGQSPFFTDFSAQNIFDQQEQQIPVRDQSSSEQPVTFPEHFLINSETPQHLSSEGFSSQGPASHFPSSAEFSQLPVTLFRQEVDGPGVSGHAQSSSSSESSQPQPQDIASFSGEEVTTSREQLPFRPQQHVNPNIFHETTATLSTPPHQSISSEVDFNPPPPSPSIHNTPSVHHIPSVHITSSIHNTQRPSVLNTFATGSNIHLPEHLPSSTPQTTFSDVRQRPQESTSPRIPFRTESVTPQRPRPTEPPTVLRLQPTEPSTTLRPRSTETSTPLRLRPTESSTPFRLRPTELSAPLRPWPTAPSSSLRTRPTESSTPLRLQPTELSTPLQTRLTESAPPLRPQPTESSTPLRPLLTFSTASGSPFSHTVDTSMEDQHRQLELLQSPGFVAILSGIQRPEVETGRRIPSGEDQLQRPQSTTTPVALTTTTTTTTTAATTTTRRKPKRNRVRVLRPVSSRRSSRPTRRPSTTVSTAPSLQELPSSDIHEFPLSPQLSSTLPSRFIADKIKVASSSSSSGTPVVGSDAKTCDPNMCKLPNCFCGGNKLTPGNLDPSEIPQMVLLTFDDSVNEINYQFYSSLLSNGRKNPNGCPILGTFYVSHEWTDYAKIQTLHAQGHEMASHSITHSDGAPFTEERWRNEIYGQKRILSALGGINVGDIRGMRAPFLQGGGNKQFAMLHETNFTYDSSIPSHVNKPPTWPYTLDYRMPHECGIPPCPNKSYPGVWEVPMVMWEDLKGGHCAMADACQNPTDERGVYDMLVKNFKRHYTSNRAPFGMFYHYAWFTHDHHRKGFMAFMDAILQLPDVYFVTNSQMIQWMQNPTPLSRISDFAPWKCNSNGDTRKCSKPKRCSYRFKGDERQFPTCQPCPDKFPWLETYSNLQVLR